MELLLTNLNHKPPTKITEWKYENNDIYEKFTQYKKENIIINDNKENQNIINDNKEIIKNEELIVNNNDEKEKNPLNIILKHYNLNYLIKDYFKKKLLENITKENYIKLFGKTKISEIMTGLTREGLNKSVVLLLSFFINKNIMYKDKIISFYKKEDMDTIVLS